ncbi:hypothetical protein N7457_006117 [Penicillium paradoxum]|uniref:uncharacterized protein n=1 Tax=Penicillium paradoxum TaxID=176176 RepID=UPI0025495EF8|nr:uncharacterized protein N7457_006117 [Penicillium paradoxum]KAJ5780957.1 hypothetical protein N7457_006117 [Penicillium paradoxum]
MNTNPPSSGASGEPQRKGSVKRARQLLEAGVRPEQASPPQQMRYPPGPRNMPQQPQWPLPDSGLPPHPISHQPRYLPPRGPPLQRPPNPSEAPSPSIYSERDGHYQTRLVPRPPQAFSQLQRPPPLQSCRPSLDGPASPASTIDLTPRISIATDDLFRQSVASSTASIPDVPPFPPPESHLSHDEPKGRTAGLVAPPNTRRSPPARQSSVSPIPEEFAGSRFTKCSVASSRAMPSSWGSGPAESEILGAYSDGNSDDGHPSPRLHEETTTLVRNASLGKRGKPTMRTILKSNPVSEVPVAATQPSFQENPAKSTVVAPIDTRAATNQIPVSSTRPRNASTSTASSGSLNGVDPEKSYPHDEPPYSTGLEKELEIMGTLPKAAPTMSDKRPGGHKPPALNIHAVRDAEARGSLSSLTDLIRRATKLASNLDRGRTASRADLAGGGEAEFMSGKGTRPCNSGSLSDILASFPPPGLATPEGRGSWPVFFGRSNLRNVEPLGSDADDPNAPRRRKMCCGMPRKLFVLMCIAIFIIVILAVLLPVFLVAVPREKASACAQENPCENGGVSVSSGTECSCVCSNGYVGSKCTTAGDDSCTTSLIQNGSNATMGSALPTLFRDSKEKFDITLDPVTIMALFSMNDVSCRTENALVSFDGVKANSISKARRSPQNAADLNRGVSTPVVKTDPTPVLAARAEATMHGGIVYDDSESSNSATTTSTPTKTASAATASATKISAEAISTGNKASTAPSIPEDVVGFSRVAVLYILQKTGSLDSARSSEESIEVYLVDSYTNATHPVMKVGAFSLDFEELTITLPNSTVKAE